MIRHDTDPILTYTVTEDGSPVDMTGSTIVFTMGNKVKVPDEYVTQELGTKAFGTIRIVDGNYEVGDGVTIGSTFFDSATWGVGGTVEADRDLLLAEINNSSEPVVATPVSTDTILVTHEIYDSVVGNAIEFTKVDPINADIELTPITGFLSGGVDPDTITFSGLKKTWVAQLTIGDELRIEYGGITERLVISDIDYQEGDVTVVRYYTPHSYYGKGARLWFIKVNRKAGSFQGNDNNELVYEWESEDTDTPGTWYGQFEVTKVSGKVQTYPTNEYITVTIDEDLDNT